jgi:hypothetical protein
VPRGLLGGDRYQPIGGANSPQTGKIDALFFLDIDSVKSNGNEKNSAFLVVPLDRLSYQGSTIEYYISSYDFNCTSGSINWLSDSFHLASGNDVINKIAYNTSPAGPNVMVYLLKNAVCNQPIPAPSAPVYRSRDSALGVAKRYFARNQ